MNDTDRQHLIRAVDLAEIGMADGNDPFGSVLVSEDGKVLFEDHNHTSGGDHTRHPEFEIARWAATHMAPADRARAVVYTSGEHCPMCAAAHGWVGLGKIVYAASSAQFAGWVTEFGGSTGPVKTLPIEAILVSAEVEGPEPTLTERLRSLHQRRYEAGGYGNS
jgi:tRNA(Arg) A34 adenosine deaminase TadA